MTAPPAWLRRVAADAEVIDPARLSRLLPPDDGSARPAAVLLLLTRWDERDAVVLLQRSDALRSHAGQVAFPGGAAEPGDDGPAGTALREAHEEAGIDAADVEVVGTWPTLWIPVSNFAVTPVLAWWREPHEVTPDGAEMLRAEIVALDTLADPDHRLTVTAPSGWRGPAFDVNGLMVWGFTAGLLDKVLAFGGFARPWDADVRVEPAPLLPAELWASGQQDGWLDAKTSGERTDDTAREDLARGEGFAP